MKSVDAAWRRRGLDVCLQRSVDAARRREVSNPLLSPRWRRSERETAQRMESRDSIAGV